MMFHLLFKRLSGLTKADIKVTEIFICSVAGAIRIRTGEYGNLALS